MEPLARLEFEAETLMREHPPVLRHPCKRLVYEIACPPDVPARGKVGFTRWREIEPPGTLDLAVAPAIEPRAGFFDYAPVRADAVEWHVNFADPVLFVAYGGPLLAQDELQVAEHPVLGALREALLARGVAALTASGGLATPVLVTGAERRCVIDTGGGLYGNAFARAGEARLRAAVRRLEPPTVTHLVAMAAPAGGWGRYQRHQIAGALATATTAFTAARLESARLAGGAPRAVVVHTGWWGCGAFGGNRVLMAMVQALAARLARLDGLVFHFGSADGRVAFDEALDRLDDLLAPHGARAPTAALLDGLDSMAFAWGVSDGN